MYSMVFSFIPTGKPFTFSVSYALGVGSAGTQTSGNAVSLKGMQGASVSFHVIRNPDLQHDYVVRSEYNAP